MLLCTMKLTCADLSFTRFCSVCALLLSSEFLKFINTRVLNGSGSLNGLPNLVNASAAVKFAEDATPSQMLETLVKTMRNTNLSIQSIFETFDSDSDRALDEAEFYQAICALGFVLTNAQSHEFFNALDTDNSGTVNIAEFSQLVVNPNKSLVSGHNTLPQQAHSPAENS